MHIQEQLEALKDEQRVLVSDCESAKQQLTVAEAGSSSLLEQYQAAVSEREGLRTHCKMMESQLSEVREEEEQIKIELQERHVELESLKNDLAEVREKYSKLEHQWSEKEATFVEQERVLKEHILSLEVRRLELAIIVRYSVCVCVCVCVCRIDVLPPSVVYLKRKKLYSNFRRSRVRIYSTYKRI